MPLSRQEQTEHQRRVCTAACKMLSRVHNETVVITATPDAHDSTQPRCDYEAQGSGIHHVIEHTMIEAFTNRIASQTPFGKIFGELELVNFNRGVGVNGRFNLVCNDRLSLMDARRWDEIRDNLARWVLEKAPSLANEAKNSPEKNRVLYPARISEQPAGVPFAVTLKCRELHESKFLVSSNVPDNLEDLSRLRLKTALENKCPKLETWRQQFSSLVLEEADISLGNECATCAHLSSLLKTERLAVPNFIIYVDTAIPAEWVVHLLKNEDQLGAGHFLFLDPVNMVCTSDDSSFEE